MVSMVIGIIVSLLAVHCIYCMKHEGVTIYIGQNKPCIGTVTFTYDAKDGYTMVVSFAEAPQGETFAGIGANVLPCYKGLTETINQFKTKRSGKATQDGKVFTFSQVQIEPKDTIVVAGEEITAVTGVFEPTSRIFIILKSTLDRKPNQLYSTLQAVQGALKKSEVDNISRVAYIIRLGGDYAEYYAVNFSRFQDCDFQRIPERDQTEKTLVLYLTRYIARLADDEATQVHWIKINKNVIEGKISPDVDNYSQSIGEYIHKNNNEKEEKTSIGITCIAAELGTLIKACAETKPKEIGIWGPLAYFNRPQASYTWEKLQAEPMNVGFRSIKVNVKVGGVKASITIQPTNET